MQHADDETTPPLLVARDLHYHYDGSICALQGLNLTVRTGAKIAVLGANGAGKSTLFLHLNGTLRPERGEVLLQGQRADYRRQALLHWRQQVGLVLQNPDDQLFAPTVEQDVSFGPLNLGLDENTVRDRISEALCALGIEILRDRPTHLLSYGQRKRAAIAGVLAMRPRVVILDEPFAGLDPAASEDLLITLDELHTAGTTIVLATHDLDLALAWANEVAVLRHGTVARQGRPLEVLRDEELLRSAGLRMPLLLEIGAHLQSVGLYPPHAPLPRSLAELRAALTFTK